MDAYRGRNAPAVSHVTRKLLHNRCKASVLGDPTMAMGPKNVFNNKADFKVLLPLDRFRMTVGPDIPPRVSAARNEPNWEKRQMATKGHRSGQDAAPATNLPWLSRYPRGVDWRMPLRVAPLYALLDDTASRHGRLVCTNFLGKTLR